MSRDAVSTAGAPAPLGPYSQAIVTGGLVFSAGQIGIDPASGRLVPGGAVAELGQAIANLEAVLIAAGSGLDLVVKTTLYAVDLAEGAALNARYAATFPIPHPARSTVGVAALPGGAQVEIEAVAVRREG